MSTIREGLLEFSNLPWTTNILEADLADFADKIPELKHFVDALAKEDANPHVNTAYHELKCYFDARGSTKLSSDAFDCFFEYRLLDVLNRSQLKSPYIKREQPHLPPVVLSDIAPTFGFKWLEDWPLLITQTIKRIENSLLDPDFCAKLKQTENDKNFRWTSLCATRATSNITSTLANIDQAAFYLHHIVRGHRKLPNNIKSLQVKYGGHETPRLGQEGCSKISLLKAPLHVALVSSPISLLVPKKLSAKSVSNLKFIRVWQELRRSKPEVVDYVENVLWNLIFDAATGTRPDILASLRADLQMVERVLNDIKDPEMLSWFPPLTRDSTVTREPRGEKAARWQPVSDSSDDESSDENVRSNGRMQNRNRRPMKRRRVITSDSESEQDAFTTPEPLAEGDEITKEITSFMDVDLDQPMNLGAFDNNGGRPLDKEDTYSQDVDMDSDGREDMTQPDAESTRSSYATPAPETLTETTPNTPPPASHQHLALGTSEYPHTPRATPAAMAPPASNATPGARPLPTPHATPAATAPHASNATPEARMLPTPRPTPAAMAPPASNITPGARLSPTPHATPAATAPPASNATPGARTLPTPRATPAAMAPPASNVTPGARLSPTPHATPAAMVPPASNATPGARTLPTPRATPAAMAPPASNVTPGARLSPTPYATPAAMVPPASNATPGARTSPTPRATPASPTTGTMIPPISNPLQTSPTPPTKTPIQTGSNPAPEKSGKEARYPTRSTRGTGVQGGGLQQNPSVNPAYDREKQTNGTKGNSGVSNSTEKKSTGANAASSGKKSTGANAASSGKKTAHSTNATFKLEAEITVETVLRYCNEVKKATGNQNVKGFRCQEVTDLCEEFRDNIKADPPFKNPEGVGLGPRYRTEDYTIPLPDNSGSYTFAAEFHFNKEKVRFEALMKVATEGFHNNLPRYISSPQTSKIRVMKHSEFVEKSHENIAEILKTHHIVTTGEPVEGGVKRRDIGVQTNGDEQMEVDDVDEEDQMNEDKQEKGREDKVRKFKQCVESVCDVERSCTIHDLSLPVKGLDHGSRHTVGTPGDIVRAAQAIHGKAANGLDNPTWEDSKDQRRHPCSSDCHAWDATVSRPFCHRNRRYPTYPMRWHLISTGGCFHTMHIDSDGVGTIVCVKCGCKIWFVAVPKDGSTIDDFATASIFDDSFDIEGTNAHLFDIEVIILLPGIRYIQKPNTAHAVYTSEPTVVEGSHFYSSATLADTVYGVLHTYLRGSSITNTDNREVCFELLCRLVAYYHGHYVEGRFTYKAAHIPSVDQFDGLLDIVRLCIVMELSNALNFWPVEGLSPEPGRYRLIYARKRCRELLDCLFANLIIKETTGLKRQIDGKGEIFWEYFAQIAATLINHARDADSEGLKNYLHHLDRHVVFCFFDDEDTRAVLSRFLHRLSGGDNDTFCWTGPQYTVERRCEEWYSPDERSGLNLSDQIRGITDEAVANAAGGWWVS